jgi:hypothetical protein
LGEIADILDRAALLIEHDGRETGGYWADDDCQYEPGTSLCAAAAIGVAAGYTTRHEIEDDVVGVSDRPGPRRHPAFAAMMDQLRAVHAFQVFAWSDSATPDQVVARLRACAADVRAVAADDVLIERIRRDETIAPGDRLVAMLRAWRRSVRS